MDQRVNTNRLSSESSGSLQCSRPEPPGMRLLRVCDDLELERPSQYRTIMRALQQDLDDDDDTYIPASASKVTFEVDLQNEHTNWNFFAR